MGAVCRVEHLTKRYKGAAKNANEDLTFNIYEGEIFGLPGPNGAGKSGLSPRTPAPSSGSASSTKAASWPWARPTS